MQVTTDTRLLRLLQNWPIKMESAVVRHVRCFLEHMIQLFWSFFWGCGGSFYWGGGAACLIECQQHSLYWEEQPTVVLILSLD